MSIEDDHDDYHHPGDQNGTPEHVGHVHLPCISDNGFSGFFGLAQPRRSFRTRQPSDCEEEKNCYQLRAHGYEWHYTRLDTNLDQI